MIFELINVTVLTKLDLTQFESSEITEEDIAKEFEENPEKYVQYNISHILVCFEGKLRCEQNTSEQDAKDMIDEVYDKLLEGQDFAKLAGEYSTGPTGPNGGLLGWVGEYSQMDSVFLEETFKLSKASQFSMPFETDFGYHIVKVNEIMDEFEDFKTQISFQLQFENQMNNQNAAYEYQSSAVDAYIEELRKKSVVVNHKDKLTANVDPNPKIQTFSFANNEMCTEDGKPIVILFSTTWCPHCEWIIDTFDGIAKEYADKGLIAAYHWELDTADNTLTAAKESEVPQEHKEIYEKFNPRGSIPTFVFGCQYHRIGNGYESEQSLEKEANEFRAVIEELTK
jgi:thiol-disulfide isomerase/thioredoxin